MRAWGGRSPLIALVALCADGCAQPRATSEGAAAPVPSATSVTTAEAVPGAPSEVPASGTAPVSPAPRAAVPVTITGLAVRGPDGALEICAGESVRPCPGVRVRGELAPELISTRERPLIARLSGLFDGDELALGDAQLVGAAQRVPKPQLHCDLALNARGDQSRGRTLAEELERRYPERYAGVWWDRERGVYTVWVKGDASDIERPAPREGVCVLGGARFSERELMARYDALQAALGETSVRLVEGGPDVLGNRVRVRVENVDQPTLARLRAAGGEALELVSFIELREHSLAELPAARPRGDVPLITSPLRSSTAMMHALGHFSVQLDEAQRCVWLAADGGKRYLPLWPFGYAAFIDPLRIVDFDDVEVAREGTVVAFGGGHVPLPPTLSARACGAESAWSGAPSRR